MNKALVLVMCDVLVLSAMSLSSGTFSSSGLSGNDTDSKSFTKKEIDDAKVKQIVELEKYKSELELAKKRAKSAKKEAEQAKERAKELESEFVTVKAAADSEKKERIEAEKRAETAEKKAEQARGRAKELELVVTTAKLVEKSEREKRMAVEKKIADIKEAEEEKKRRIDRMNYAIGEMWVSQKNKEERKVYGLVVRTNSNEVGGRYLLVNEDKIKKIKDISSIKIKMKLGKEEVSYSVKNVFTLKNNGKKTGVFLLEFDPPREIFSLFLDADEWVYELNEKKSLHHFQAKSGSTHVVDNPIKGKWGVSVGKIREKIGDYSAGDVLIFAKSGRVALVCEEDEFLKQRFVPIEKIELEKVSLGE